MSSASLSVWYVLAGLALGSAIGALRLLLFPRRLEHSDPELGRVLDDALAVAHTDHERAAALIAAHFARQAAEHDTADLHMRQALRARADTDPRAARFYEREQSRYILQTRAEIAKFERRPPVDSDMKQYVTDLRMHLDAAEAELQEFQQHRS